MISKGPLILQTMEYNIKGINTRPSRGAWCCEAVKATCRGHGIQGTPDLVELVLAVEGHRHDPGYVHGTEQSSGSKRSQGEGFTDHINEMPENH